MDVRAARGASVDAEAARGRGRRGRSGAGYGAEAACGLATVSEVPLTEEG
jgi:hypothetical protein